MDLVLKIAWRNIMRHRGKSLVIGLMLFVGAFIMTVGNGVVSGMDAGLRKTIVNSFTGDIVLISDKQESDNVLDVWTTFMNKPVAPVYNYIDIKKELARQPYIERILPAGKNLAMVLNEEGGMPGSAYLVGIDFAQYGSMFPGNINVVEGRLPDKGEHGAVVPVWARKEFEAYTSMWFLSEGHTLDTALLPKEVKPDIPSLLPRTSAVLMGYNEDNSTTDIRLDIKGIIEYKALNSLWGKFVIVDIESYRRCFGYFAASDKVDLSDDEKRLFSMSSENLDGLFTADAVTAGDPGVAPKKAALTHPKEVDKKPLDLDAGAYNLVFVLLKKGENQARALARLNTVLKEKKLGVRAVSWKKALGVVGSMATLIKAALFMFVMFLFFVVIIIIVNTLSMAAIERTAEIGMMRAVGAKKGFISMMFLAETSMLSFVFGGAGIIIGIVGVNVLALFNITSTNDMVQLLFGGDTFHPLLTALDILLSVVQLAIVTLIAVVYPARVAQSITPLDAVARE